MKRVLSACLYQTIKFTLDDRFPLEEAKAKVKNELASYKEKYKGTIQILKETSLEDGSFILSIRKMVSNYPIGDYFNEVF